MASDTYDTRSPRGKCVQIKGQNDDALIGRLEAYAKRRGIAVATAARMLIKEQLDAVERNPHER